MANIVPTPRSINSDPAVAAYVITPSDTVEIPTGPCRAISVGATGDITMTVLQNVSGQNVWVAVLFPTVPAGIWPIGTSRVNSTGTTATGLRALY